MAPWLELNKSTRQLGFRLLLHELCPLGASALPFLHLSFSICKMGAQGGYEELTWAELGAVAAAQDG